MLFLFYDFSSHVERKAFSLTLIIPLAVCQLILQSRGLSHPGPLSPLATLILPLALKLRRALSPLARVAVVVVVAAVVPLLLRLSLGALVRSPTHPVCQLDPSVDPQSTRVAPQHLRVPVFRYVQILAPPPQETARHPLLVEALSRPPQVLLREVHAEVRFPRLLPVVDLMYLSRSLLVARLLHLSCLPRQHHRLPAEEVEEVAVARGRTLLLLPM